jgi:hypothetical protein
MPARVVDLLRNLPRSLSWHFKTLTALGTSVRGMTPGRVKLLLKDKIKG